MSQIDYQKLREIAEKTKIAGEAPVMPFDQRINALNDFMKHFSPDIALALLDERERNQQYIKRRDQENEEIALTVGKLRVELEGKDSKIANLTAERDALREGEMGDARHSNTRSAADIYFQLVEECEIPAGGSLVEYVDDMREKLEAAEKRIAELEAEPVSQDYKLNALDGNSPVTPDSWISRFEEMPDPSSEKRVCAFTPTNHEDMRYRFVPASLFKTVCRDATHWFYMLPPVGREEVAGG